MKKIVKILLTVLLVLVAIGGTCILFFKNLKPEVITTESLIGYITKTNDLEFDVVNYDSRFSAIMQTNENLEDCLASLSPYLMDDNISVSDEKIIAKLNEVSYSVNLASRMIAEYKIKEKSSFYNKDLGRNDLYTTMCEYLEDYATVINMINNKLADSSLNRSVDLKFDMIDLYCRVVIDTYAEPVTGEESKIVGILDASNINVMNDYFCLETSYITEKPVQGKYQFLNTQNNNKFTKYYNDCNRDEFAKNLHTNITNITGITNESTAVELATYYFKLIYGI